MIQTTKLGRRGTEIFWGEISPCDHFVQLYEDNTVFLDTLEGFVSGGFRNGDAIIIIAIPAHRQALENRLRERGLNVDEAQASDQYISLDAEETLASFMVNGWPDGELFKDVVDELLTRVRKTGRQVRAFGEMVALLWSRGQNGATVRLEHLWHKLCQEESFSLFCAYPKIGFTQDMSESLSEICEAHSKLVIV